MYHPPHGVPRGSVVFVHAFAEEMNKSRHIVAQASRRLAAQGLGVLLMDLKGCGDSTGSLVDASWDDWRDDVRLAVGHMRRLGHGPLVLWGMRLGAMLAAQGASDAQDAVARCVFWQPVTQGESHLVQFLRLRLANAMLSGAKDGESGKALRARLAAGESLEIAGYPLSSSMSASLERMNLEALRPPCPVHWFEVIAQPQQPLPAAAVRVTSAWTALGSALTVTPLVAEPFWGATNATELVQCPALVEATAHEARAWA